MTPVFIIITKYLPTVPLAVGVLAQISVTEVELSSKDGVKRHAQWRRAHKGEDRASITPILCVRDCENFSVNK